MAQSATKERALLGTNSFWDRPTLEPPLRWERWRIILELAILFKEGISIDTLREAPPDKVTLTLEPIYEEDVDNSTARSERDRRILIKQLKNACLNNYTVREYCAVIVHGTFAIPKLSRSPTLALEWKAVGYLDLKNRLFRLIKFLQRTFGRAWTTSSLSREIKLSIIMFS